MKTHDTEGQRNFENGTIMAQYKKIVSWRDMMGGMDWIDLAQDRDQRRDLENTVMNLRVP
jgi:hypothetical protein